MHNREVFKSCEMVILSDIENNDEHIKCNQFKMIQYSWLCYILLNWSFYSC